jgi:FERM central domain
MKKAGRKDESYQGSKSHGSELGRSGSAKDNEGESFDDEDRSNSQSSKSSVESEEKRAPMPLGKRNSGMSTKGLGNASAVKLSKNSFITSNANKSASKTSLESKRVIGHTELLKDHSNVNNADESYKLKMRSLKHLHLIHELKEPPNDKTSKFKSASEKPGNLVIDYAMDWKPPLRRRINVWGEVEYVTVQVRIFHGDSEHDFSSRFLPNEHTAQIICDAIAAREGLNVKERKLFSIWIVGKDLELQVRSYQDIFEVVSVWNEWVVKYTHYPEAANPANPINRHWFVYRKEASISIKEEKALMRESGQLLVYGQARTNYLSSRYVCTWQVAVELAATMLQIMQGDYDQRRYPIGFLKYDYRKFRDPEKLASLIPPHLISKLSNHEWEDLITKKYVELTGFLPIVARQLYLAIVRKWECYGCSFFPVCVEPPPSGYFEYRTQNWALGAGPNGIVIIDYDSNVQWF